MNFCALLQDSFMVVSDLFVAEMTTLDHVITQSIRYNKLNYILQNLTISLDDLLFRWTLYSLSKCSIDGHKTVVWW